MLTLAAYNAGEGRVQRALNKQNSKHFPSLRLPAETINYVHKFYALMDLVDIAVLSHSIALDQGSNSHQRSVTNKLPPLDLQQKELLAELFETKQIINMAPVRPLISL